MTEARLCVICAVRGRTPVHYEQAQVCPPCRVWLAEILTEVSGLTGQLAQYLIPRKSGSQRVSGSREAPLPFTADVYDLAAAARPASIGVAYRHGRRLTNPDPDQVGHLSVATELEFWVVDWIATRGEGEHLPVPLVPPLAGWLSARLTWAMDNHPAIDEFATALWRIRGALSAYVLKVVEDEDDAPRRRAESRTAPCPSCDMISLWWWPTDERVRCDTQDCNRVMTAAEYGDWEHRITHPAHREWLGDLARERQARKAA